MLKNKFMIVLVFSVLCTAGLCMGEVVYVDADAPGADNGESWADAYTDLQSALGDVVPGDQIWVAAGVYKPGTSTSNSFAVVDGVDVYGGFAGDEANLDDRDWLANKTYLSGEITAGSSIRIIYATSITNSAIIDGFEISGANYGIWVSSTNLSIANCTIRNNNYDGIYATGGSTVDITDCAIDNNNKHGIYCNGLVDMTITGSIVGDNGQNGINCYGRNVVIKNNWIHHNGQDGIYCSMPNDTGIVQNNTIVYNTGSGIYNNDDVYYTPTISNCIFWGNDGEDLYHCEATYSCIEDPDTGDGVIHSDPYFASSDPELRDFHLSADSNCIDAGDPYDVYTGQVDIDGQMRVAHGGSGYGRIVDIGGDELAGADIDTLADINVDGIVNLLDYAAFGPTWDTLSNDPNWDGRCDLEVDDVIDTADYVIFINEWLWEASWRASEDVFDFDGGGVGVSDLHIFLEAWLSRSGDGNYNAACDYNSKDGVNIVDYAIFAGHWME